MAEPILSSGVTAQDLAERERTHAELVAAALAERMQIEAADRLKAGQHVVIPEPPFSWRRFFLGVAVWAALFAIGFTFGRASA